MIYKIENNNYTAEVNSMGAELHSLKSKKDSTEYVWYGNPDIWYGQAPILFPVVGQVKNNTITVDGKEYFMPKHGLVRKMEFSVKSQTENEIVFSISSDENTLKQYPYEFELLVSYSLVGEKLVARHTVINKNDGEMYFSFGAHPGFNCEIGDTLVFEKNETMGTERISSDNLIIPKVFPLLDNENTVTVTEDIFKEDALILSGFDSEKVTLESPGLKRKIEFVFGKIPFLGVWAKPGAPYVCIEPWFGVNDGQDDYGEFKNKRGIQHLEKGEEFEFVWTAQPMEY